MADIRVLVVDDHPVVRIGLIMSINQESGLEVIGEAEGSNEAIEKALKYSPDVVVMDLELSDESGIDAIRGILEDKPDTGILVLSAHNDGELVIQAFDAGAIGYILKGLMMEEIFDSIRKVHSKEEVIGPGIANTMVRSALNRSRAGPGPEDLLSKRELEVLRLTTNGASVPKISEKLELSLNTVRTYHQRAMRKLDLHSQNELFKYAMRNNLIDVD